MAKTKKITIGDLAIMVKHGFNEMDSWFKPRRNLNLAKNWRRGQKCR